MKITLGNLFNVGTSLLAGGAGALGNIAKMKPAQWLPAVGGVLNAFSGASSGNSAAGRLDRNTLKLLEEQIMAQAAGRKQAGALADRIERIAVTALDNGLYDPERRSAALKAQFSANLDDALGNVASQSRLLGYRPGDSVPTQNLRSQAANYSRRFANEMEGYRLQQPSLEMSLLGQALQNRMNTMANAQAGDMRTMQMATAQADRLRANSDVSALGNALMAFLNQTKEEATPQPNRPNTIANKRRPRKPMSRTPLNQTMLDIALRGTGPANIPSLGVA